jgi:hypothetical protein
VITDSRDPRYGLRPWIQGLPIPIVFAVCALLLVPAILYGAAIGAWKYGTEAASDVLSTMKRLAK